MVIRALAACGALLLGAAALTVAMRWYRPAPLPASPPTQLTSIGAELLVLQAPSIATRGSGRIIAVRLANPTTQLIPYHFRAEGLHGPLPIDQWGDRLGVPLAFNAGQFDENLNHLGWLKGNNRWLQPHRKESWKGLLVTGPLSPNPWGKIVDLHSHSGATVENYRHAVQSMMLFDDQQQLRVRTTERSASRTVIAQDAHGRLLVLVTEGAVTLAELARWLIASPLGLVRAMNLDGGIESQLYIDTPELQLTHFGQYSTARDLLQQSAGKVMRYPLPAVVALSVAVHEAPQIPRDPKPDAK